MNKGNGENGEERWGVEDNNNDEESAVSGSIEYREKE